MIQLLDLLRLRVLLTKTSCPCFLNPIAAVKPPIPAPTIRILRPPSVVPLVPFEEPLIAVVIIYLKPSSTIGKDKFFLFLKKSKPGGVATSLDIYIKWSVYLCSASTQGTLESHSLASRDRTIQYPHFGPPPGREVRARYRYLAHSASLSSGARAQFIGSDSARGLKN